MDSKYIVNQLNHVKLDWPGLVANLRRQGTPHRVFYYEHGITEQIKQSLAEKYDLCRGLDQIAEDYKYKREIAIHRFLGQELFRVFPPRARMEVPAKRDRWVDEHQGPIASWEDFGRFQWPNPRDADLSVLDYYQENLPPDMRVFHVVDVWEVVRSLFGFETFCYKLFEDRDLIEAAFEKVGSFAMAVVESCCDYDCFGAVVLSDDLGYKTGLMISPQAVRNLIIPWHKKIADIVHGHGKLLLFHCCGKMYELIDDYIDYVKIDAKHSFEEAVLPITEAKRQYGKRLSLLGGMDVDLLARGQEAAIRAKTREIISVCLSGGGFCFGAGNWVTDYIPLENYLVMLDEARKCSL